MRGKNENQNKEPQNNPKFKQRANLLWMCLDFPGFDGW